MQGRRRKKEGEVGAEDKRGEGRRRRGQRLERNRSEKDMRRKSNIGKKKKCEGKEEKKD